MKRFDAIVVGAGPAGSTAALIMAREGLRVLLLERGDLPGQKNMFGGILHGCPILDRLFSGFWEHAPWERNIVRRVLTLITEEGHTSMAFESMRADEAPYSGRTLFRPRFDRWLAERAGDAGATVLCGCVAEEPLFSDGKVCGVRVERARGEIGARVVIAADGALSMIARRAGLRREFSPGDMAIGIKALFRLPQETINERFQLLGRQGASHEFIGCTGGVRGGGFIYTQSESLSVGLVLGLDALKKGGTTPYELLDRFIATEPVRKLLKGASLIEYSAHLLPHAGYRMVPRLYTGGMLLAGEAGSLCYSSGLDHHGMDLAITSGALAAETVLEAFSKGDFSSKVLSSYEARLRDSFVLKDMKTFKGAAEWMRTDRLFSTYPLLVSSIMDRIFRSDGTPRKRMGRICWETLRETMPVRHLLADLIKGGKAYL